ncbi:hypothetical protein [Streptomyces anulatus]|uniref:hypothetical protein n=1 Tax=Streptomyces anulatus TaxID=1892 RepID=UPI001C258F77|nr:hypothetical protein [Streptomyces anulatus]
MPTSTGALAPTGYDHTHPVPELVVDGELAGHPARFTLRPTVLDDAEGCPAPGVTVRAATRFRIPLVFESVARRHTPGQWATDWVRSLQDSHLASVRTVEPLVAPAVASVLAEHDEQLLPLLDFAREREAGHALALVQQCRRDVAEAGRRLREAEADFARHGVSAQRALEVLDALTKRRDTLWGRPHS